MVPEARLDLVRVGIAAYGIDPAPGIAARAEPLRPVMRLRAQLINVKDIPAGAGVSYGWTWIADAPRRSVWCRSVTATEYPDTRGTEPVWGGPEPGADTRPDLHGPVRRRVALRSAGPVR